VLAQAAQHFPQGAYPGLQKSLQQECQFLQQVRRDTGENFTKVEKAITQVFIPALFDDKFDNDDPRCQLLACLPVKNAGLALPDATSSAE
jgi:hypothetical protein